MRDLFNRIEKETMATTLLEKMGFSDPDRKDPMHDAACDYLAQKAAQLVALFVDVPSLERAAESAVDALLIAQVDGTHQKAANAGWGHSPESAAKYAVDAWQEALAPKVTHEYHVVKPGYRPGQPGQTVGFVDLRVESFLDVEVKWCEYSVSDAIRQIGVYRENECNGNWILAAPYVLNIEQKSALDSQNILYVQLDRAKVEAFAKERRATKVTSVVL